MTDRQLINLAEQASRNAYVPYSHFAVGAALECRDGTVFTGCNIENAALGSTICAERTAACKAVSEGHRDFVPAVRAGSFWPSSRPIWRCCPLWAAAATSATA